MVVDPQEHHKCHIRTEKELEKLPLTVKNQESTIFRIRTGKKLVVKPEVKYRIDIIGETVEGEMIGCFEVNRVKDLIVEES